MHTAESSVRFAICISGQADGDLEVWKIYRVLPDPKEDELGCLRVIDESGEDYLYLQSQFILVELPKDIRDRLLAAIEG